MIVYVNQLLWMMVESKLITQGLDSNGSWEARFSSECRPVDLDESMSHAGHAFHNALFYLCLPRVINPQLSGAIYTNKSFLLAAF